MWVHASENAAARAAARAGSKCLLSLINTDVRMRILISYIFHMGISEDGYQHGQQRGQEIDLSKRTTDTSLKSVCGGWRVADTMGWHARWLMIT